jgi:GDP-D-mannose 3', 5'-epimerase
MKIVVTGGAGMIGSNLVKKLVKEGHDVKVIDNLWRGSLENIESIVSDKFSIKKNFILGDLSSFSDWNEAFIDCEVVYHLADIVAGIDFVFNNQGYIFRQNFLINTNVFYAAKLHKINRLIYVGTACSFPQELQNSIKSTPLLEDQQYPANPESAYGWSKLMGEYEALLLEKETKMDVVVLSLHNAYGFPTDFSSNRSQVIPSLIYKTLTSASNELIVWGDGQQGRAFVYVGDIIKALTLALFKGQGKGVIQIGPDYCTSIKEIAEMVIKIAEVDKKIVYDTSKPKGDIGRSANYLKAKVELGWEPEVSLEIGLKKTIEWITSKYKC